MTSAIHTIKLLNEASQEWAEVIVCTGVGTHQSLVCRHFSFDYPRRRLLTSCGHGTMGVAVPFALGAQLADPEALILAINGDGSSCMDIVHLCTAAEYGLAIKTVVLDNGAAGIVSQFERLQGYGHVATMDRPNPDFADIAKACGCVGWNADETADWKLDEWTAFLDLEAPALAHIEVDDVGVWPILEGQMPPDKMTGEIREHKNP